MRWPSPQAVQAGEMERRRFSDGALVLMDARGGYVYIAAATQ
jgi:hypothetical protein